MSDEDKCVTTCLTQNSRRSIHNNDKAKGWGHKNVIRQFIPCINTIMDKGVLKQVSLRTYLLEDVGSKKNKVRLMLRNSTAGRR